MRDTFRRLCVEVHATAAGKKVALVNLGCVQESRRCRGDAGQAVSRGTTTHLILHRPIISLSIPAALFRALKTSPSTMKPRWPRSKPGQAEKTGRYRVSGAALWRRTAARNAEIDVLVGTGDFQHLPPVLVQLHTPLPQRTISATTFICRKADARIQTTPGHTAYIKMR